MDYTKKDQLIDRITENYCDYKYSLKGVSRKTMFDMAGRIATVTEVYRYLHTEYEWGDESEIDFLLLFNDPLTIIADAWESRKADITADIDEAIWDVSNDDDVIAEYPLDEGVNDYILYTGE